MRIILIGSSGHAGVMADLIARTVDYELAGVIDDFRLPGENAFGSTVLGGLEDLPGLTTTVKASAVALGVGDNFQRRRIQQRAATLCPDLAWPALVHPSAIVAMGVELGAASVVMAGAIVQNGARLGAGSLINTRASLDHDSVLSDFASLAPGAISGGRTRIGELTAIGMGALVLQSIEVGAQSVVGAGALVNKNIPDFVVAYGSPVRVIRSRMEGEKYL